MDAEFWAAIEKAIPVIAGLVLAWVAYMGKKSMDNSKQAVETSEQTKVLVVENTAITEEIKRDVEIVKSKTP